MADIPMTYDEAVALAKEIGESLGGKQQRAIEVLMRYAARGRRPSSIRLDAVSDALVGAQHFANARSELDAGQQAMRSSVAKIRKAEEEDNALAEVEEKK